jgi:hypothetical protein
VILEGGSILDAVVHLVDPDAALPEVAGAAGEVLVAADRLFEAQIVVGAHHVALFALLVDGIPYGAAKKRVAVHDALLR